MNIKNLFTESFNSFRANLGKAVVVGLIFLSLLFIINLVLGLLIGILGSLFGLSELGIQILSQSISTPINIILTAPLMIGICTFSLNISRNSESNITDIFQGFKNRLGTYILAYLLLTFLTVVGFIFCIIPGIIAAFMFSQVFFILADDDDIGIIDAFKKSVRMMKGYDSSKSYWNYLYYIGIGFIINILYALGIFTCGIAWLFILPFQYIVLAKFHDNIKGN